MIKAVYFDGDQTLWDFEVIVRRSLAATLTQLQALLPVAKELRGTETNWNGFVWLLSRGL